ncbi:MAG: ribosome recycling factor [Planctomycetota bacterium]|nr:MAG: ribosome recycling factor [Planctomycetota bacterium]
MSTDDAFAEVALEAEEHFEKSLGALNNEFGRIRTGRAAPQMLDHVQVEMYGSVMPLRQMAQISAPEPTQLMVKPFDKNSIRAIEKGITIADLGITPQNDGSVIRLNIPPLSQERRKQLAAQAKDACEKCKVAMRNARRDAIKQIESQGKEERLSEDIVKQASEGITELLKQFESRAEQALEEKTKDILEF